LRDHNSKLARIENSNNTLALLAENGGGKTNREVVNITREQLRTTATSVKPAASIHMNTPAPNSIPQVNPIRPPVSTSQIHPTSYKGRTPTIAPLALPTTTKKGQTCNCGGSKSGTEHTHNAAINSADYCKAFGKLSAEVVDELRCRGFPKKGYGIGDSLSLLNFLRPVLAKDVG